MFALWRSAVSARETRSEFGCKRKWNGLSQRSYETATATGRRLSRARWRTSGTRDRVIGEAGEGVFIGGPWGVDKFDIHAREQLWRRTNQRVMRAGKAEDAMGAAGTAGITDRQIRSALAAMQAELEGRLSLAGRRRKIEAAERDQQALRGYGIGSDDPDQRSPRPPASYATFEHLPPLSPSGNHENRPRQSQRSNLGTNTDNEYRQCRQPAGPSGSIISAACA
jgi:hypothetical protein